MNQRDFEGGFGDSHEGHLYDVREGLKFKGNIELIDLELLLDLAVN